MGCLSAPDAMSARISWRTSSPINSCAHSITFLQKAVILFKEINQKNNLIHHLYVAMDIM
ncbi:MAG: hypothetical protein MJZ08_08865 [Bacteroidaceae bacterium]|nr:hypothetical protein [Bacteroidaceae bacterium]